VKPKTIKNIVIKAIFEIPKPLHETPSELLNTYNKPYWAL